MDDEYNQGLVRNFPPSFVMQTMDGITEEIIQCAKKLREAGVPFDCNYLPWTKALEMAIRMKELSQPREIPMGCDMAAAVEVGPRQVVKKEFQG